MWRVIGIKPALVQFIWGIWSIQISSYDWFLYKEISSSLTQSTYYIVFINQQTERTKCLVQEIRIRIG